MCVCVLFFVVVQVPHPPSIEQILARIRDAVYKKGIRTTDFFCDFDKLRSGVVPENKASANFP